MHVQRTILPLFGILSALVISGSKGGAVNNKLKLVASWKALEFVFPTKKDKNEASRRKEFIPGNLYPYDFAVRYVNNQAAPQIFITIPRTQNGPVTLGYVTKKRSPDGNPLIAPYPDLKSQRTDNCNSFISVWRIQIDRCGRLWVLDSGKIGINQICPPKLLSFSLQNNKLLTRYRFQQADYNKNSLFVNAVVDVSDESCADTFVYVADAEGYGLVVYDHQKMSSWRVENNLFWPNAEGGKFSIAGYRFNMMQGILGMALSPPTVHGNKALYFHPLSSLFEAWVFTYVIRNRTLFRDNREGSSLSFKPFGHKRSSQSAAEAMDKNGVLYFGLMTDTTIACWNSQKYDYDQKNFARIAVDPETLQYPSGVNVVPRNDGREELWVMSISYQRYVAGTLSPKDVNFRIQMGLIDDLTRGTKCYGANN